MLPPGALLRAGAFAFLPCAPTSHLHPLPHLGPSDVKNGKFLRKSLVSVKFVSAILGPEMAAPILWAPGKMRSFCRQNHVHKIPRFRGGGYFGFWGEGGEVPILFLWARGFF